MREEEYDGGSLQKAFGNGNGRTNYLKEKRKKRKKKEFDKRKKKEEKDFCKERKKIQKINENSNLLSSKNKLQKQ